MNPYELMEETVDKLCKSLKEEPHAWKFETCTFKKKGTDIEYWCSGGGPITEIWLGRGCNQVFSEQQGKRIRESYNIAKQTQASVLQEKIMKSFQ